MRGSKARPLVLASSHDVELAALASSGDRSAFGELVRRHGSTVRALLRRLGADAGQADDVAQAAFLIAFEQITEFRGEGPFHGWVKRIAARLYAKRRRRGLRLEVVVESMEASIVAADSADLEEVLGCLTEVERLCVCLCYGGGLSHAEAADALNAPLAVVRSHVKRGLDKLRTRLTAGGDGAGSQFHG